MGKKKFSFDNEFDFVVFVSQAITEEQKVKVAEYVKNCSAESGVTPEELATAKAKPEAIDTKNVKHQVCLR